MVKPFKTLLIIFTIFIFISQVFSLQIESPSQTPVNTALEVKVTDDFDNPVQNATVTFSGLEPLPIVQFTDSSGNVTYNPMTAGELNITAEKDNDSISVTVLVYQHSNITALKISAVLEAVAGNTINITILDQDDSPVGDAIVTIEGIESLPIIVYSDSDGHVFYKPTKTGILNITAEKDGIIAFLSIKVIGSVLPDDEETTPSSSGEGGGGGGTPTSFEVWIKNVLAGQTIELEIDDEDIPYIKGLSLTAKQDIYSSKLSITDYDKKPWYGMEEPDASVFRYFKVSYDKNNYVESAKFKVSVNKSWLKDNDINPSKFSLYHYTNDWVELDSEILKEDDENIYFEAATPGFSYFSLGGTSGSGYRSIKVEEETPSLTAAPTPTVTPAPKKTVSPSVLSPSVPPAKGKKIWYIRGILVV